MLYLTPLSDIMGKTSSVVSFFIGFATSIKPLIWIIIISIIIPLTFYNGFKWINLNKTFRLIRRVVLASLIVVLIYSIIEILIVKFNMTHLKKSLLNLFDYFPFTEAKTDMRLGRISSVTFEPPALGTYLLSIAGWMFSYILTEKKSYKYFPAAIVLFLGFVSGSRAAFFAIIIQFIILCNQNWPMIKMQIYMQNFQKNSLILEC